MDKKREDMYTAPILLGMAFLVFGCAMVEKCLNLLGTSLPVIDVEPQRLLDWAVTLLIFEIALTLRQAVAIRS